MQEIVKHLVRLRWEELNSTEHRNFADLSIHLLSDISNDCDEWALKSQAAALVAEMVRREGTNLWLELFPSLVTLSNIGPIQAELVSMVLRWLPEDITVHNEDLEGDRRRLLLRGLTESLPEILPLLYTLLERHFGAAVNEAGKQRLNIAKQHAATVTAVLNAINAYSDWAPLPDLSRFGIMHGCGFLLSSVDFRMHASDFFKLVSARKRPVDALATEFDLAMINVYQLVMNASRDFFVRSTSAAGAIDESELEFAECLCESMVSLGSLNLQCIVSEGSILPQFLQLMLGYFQTYKFTLHYQSLSFWLAFIRDILSKTKMNTAAVGERISSNTSLVTVPDDLVKFKITSFFTDDICSTLLDVCFQRMVQKEKISPISVFFNGSLELWSDDFEGKVEFGQYRSKLIELVRLLSSCKPVLAASKVSDRLNVIIKTLLSSSAPDQELGVLESMHFALDNVMSSVFDASSESSNETSEVHLPLRGTFEDLLGLLLSLKWTEPSLVEVHAHYLDAMGLFLKFFPDGAKSVISKLFALLNSLPYNVKDPSSSSARYARLQICASFVKIAKTAERSLLPLMKEIADTMTYLQSEGRLPRAEHNLLGEAFLIMASSAGVQQQQEVLAWFLEPLSKHWIPTQWQNTYLLNEAAFVHLCCDTAFMWSIFHTVTFFERALRRSGPRKGNSSITVDSCVYLLTSHPMAPHLMWMVPPLLKLVRALHSIWVPEVRQALPAELQAAMIISDIERTGLLGEVNVKSCKGSLSFSDGSDINKERDGESRENDLRNWLKGIRDSAYNVLGMSTTIAESFFRNFDADALVLALMENLQSMDFRHIRHLVRAFFIPFIKSCPPELWEEWIEKLLHPLFLHCQQVLDSCWSSLMHEGKAKVPDTQNIPGGSDLKIEVMEEKLLRVVTREVCSLLSTIASPELNPGLSNLEQSRQITTSDASCLADLDAFAPRSMVGFLLKCKRLAIPALQMSLQAFSWTDSEVVARISSFCGVVINLAVSTSNVELRQFVSKDMFWAIIQGLALESNAFNSAELVGHCREIFVCLADRDPAPRQVLLSLPCIKPQDLAAFEEALTKTHSPKEQKQHMRSLLLLATGNKLKALAVQKSVNTITNVSVKHRSSVITPEVTNNDEGSIGLATIM
uniref:Protein HASTY 1 n=1 Tax=Kalanchoe fedtschenkoi TaxID=63787 RepID=A0A7N0V092_KALFE